MTDVRDHLAAALEALEGEDTAAGRYHVREAAQLLDAADTDVTGDARE